jgi:multiple sugar transport system substrate-binding protein
MKKLWASLLTVAMLASFASCSGGGTTTDSTEGTDSTETTTTEEGGEAASGEKVELTFMGWEASALETQAVKNGIATFQEQNPNITVTYTPTGGNDDYNAKVMTSAASGSAPDCFFAGADAYRQYVKSGILLDITDRFDAEFSLDDFIPSAREIMTVDGRVYGIQSCIVCPILYYNKDIFDAKGIAYPDSSKAMDWDTFRELAVALTDENVYGCYGLEAHANMFDALLRSAGGSQYNEDYTKSTVDSDAARTVLTKVKSLRVDDGAAPTAVTLENAGMSANQMLQTGQVAMLADGSWSLQELSTLGFNVGIAHFPSFGTDVTTAQAHQHVIYAKTKHPDEAWTFLKFLSGMDYQGQLCKEGLWLPNRISMWEEGEQGLDGWYDEERLGTDYLNMIEYLRDAEVQAPALAPTSKCQDILIEELDMYYLEDQDIDVTLANIDSRRNAALDEAYAE